MAQVASLWIVGQPAVAGLSPDFESMSFKPVEFSYGQVLMRGGRSAKAVCMPTRKLMIDGHDVVFTHFAPSLPWVMKCVTGQINISRSALNRTTLYGDMLAKV